MKAIWFGLGLTLVFLLGLGSWPLKTKAWNLPEPSAAELKKKEAYLQSIKTGRGKTPNIVLIVADDLGKFDISLYGGVAAETPNIDRIGKEGVCFADGYTASPICAPSRAAMLTGRSNNRFGMEFQPQARYH